MLDPQCSHSSRHQFALFSPALKLLGDEEQINHWWPLARDGKIVCTYAQTELGHGTFLRGLETTAILDEMTDEIVLHTPTGVFLPWSFSSES